MEFARLRSNLAVMDILRHYHTSPQGAVEIGVLRQKWPRYALRRRDLDHSLQRLERAGLVESQDCGGRLCVRLTNDGLRLARTLVGVLALILVLPRRVWKWLDRHTAPAIATDPMMMHRRVTDRFERLGC